MERVENFLAANIIEDASQKCSIFLSVLGPRAYKLLSSLVAREKPRKKSFEELVTVMMQHHCLPPSEIVQRYRFHSRFRKLEESVAKYISELQASGSVVQFRNLPGIYAA